MATDRAALVARLRGRHRKRMFDDYCLGCGEAWPCGGADAIDALEADEAALRERIAQEIEAETQSGYESFNKGIEWAARITRGQT